MAVRGGASSFTTATYRDRPNTGGESLSSATEITRLAEDDRRGVPGNGEAGVE